MAEEIDRILGEGNEYYGGADIRQRLFDAGYMVVPLDATTRQAVKHVADVLGVDGKWRASYHGGAVE
jgi:predicted mannosyl-3-phosphoglycerate phosphatase (HAD superfamily)